MIVKDSKKFDSLVKKQDQLLFGTINANIDYYFESHFSHIIESIRGFIR